MCCGCLILFVEFRCCVGLILIVGFTIGIVMLCLVLWVLSCVFVGCGSDGSATVCLWWGCCCRLCFGCWLGLCIYCRVGLRGLLVCGWSLGCR